MLLCPVHQLKPGAMVAASVAHPTNRQRELLRPGVTLDAALIRRLQKMEVKSVWIDHDLTRDLDAALPPDLTDVQDAVCERLKNDLKQFSAKTAVNLPVEQYKQIMLDLVERMVRTPALAGFSAQMMQGDDGLFGHCAQTGIFCVMIAARMEAYVIGQRSGMDPKQARDLVAPGLAGMFHDLGKLLLDEDTKSRRQIDEAFDTEPAPASYQKHVVAGYAALRNAPMPASARQAILNHHQRFDGSGFPDLGPLTNGRTNGTQSGKQIHIFARILAAANGLTHLIADAGDRPMVLALSKFVSPSLDGWYDPQVRHAIAAQMPPFPVGTMVKLSDGQPAVVATPCPTDPCRPTVRVLEGDEAGEMIPLAEQEHESLHIAEASGEPVAKHSYDLHTVLKREAEMIKQLFAEGAADAPR